MSTPSRGLQPRAIRDHSDVRAFFDEIAPGYGETHGRADPLLAYRLGVLRDLLGPPGGALLEIGCGAGIHLAGLGADYEALRGVDISPGMIERTRELLARRGLRAELSVDGAEALSAVADGSVDAAVIVGVLEHVLDRAAALRAAARVLRPGGALALMTPNGRFWGYRLADRMGYGVRHLSTDRFLTRDELVSLVTASGLRIERERTWRFVARGDLPPGLGLALEALDPVGRALGVGSLRGGIALRAVKPA